MITQQRELERRLERNGWQVVEKEADGQWWVDETWAVRSTWRPQGLRLWLTFLVDPQHDGPRRRGEGVWAIGVTSKRPQDLADVSPTTVAIRGRWAEVLEELTSVARVAGTYGEDSSCGCQQRVTRTFGFLEFGIRYEAPSGFVAGLDLPLLAFDQAHDLARGRTEGIEVFPPPLSLAFSQMYLGYSWSF
jgi:hypothetical protein